MGLIKGLTAEKTLEILDDTVTSGVVNAAKRLILKTRGGSEIDAGFVQGPPGTMGGTTTERNLTYGVPATDAERIALANRKIVWWNTDKNWPETYFAPDGTSGLTVTGLLPGHPAGWYPVQPGVIMAHRGLASGFFSINSTSNWVTMAAPQISRGGITYSGASSLIVPIGGFYTWSYMLYVSGGTTPWAIAELVHDGDNIPFTGVTTTDKTTSLDAQAYKSITVEVKASQGYYYRARSQNPSSVWGTTGFNGCWMEVEYKGPPLVNY